MKTLDDELNDVTKLLEFTSTRLANAEQNWKYQLCEQIMEDIMSLKPEKGSWKVRGKFLRER